MGMGPYPAEDDSMLSKFKAYQSAKEFYRACEDLRGSRILTQQLLRAASSIALNLAEGSGRMSAKEKQHYYRMALGSTRECQAALDLLGTKDVVLISKADELGAMIYGLLRSLKKLI